MVLHWTWRTCEEIVHFRPTKGIVVKNVEHWKYLCLMMPKYIEDYLSGNAGADDFKIQVFQRWAGNDGLICHPGPAALAVTFDSVSAVYLDSHLF